MAAKGYPSGSRKESFAMMKKRIFASCLVLLLTLTVLPIGASALDLPNGWWPVWSAYTAAVEVGDENAILQKGDAVIELYTSGKMTVDAAGGLYEVYNLRREKAIFESRADYTAAADNTQKLLEISQYLTDNGVDRQDMIRICRTHLGVVRPTAGVYAVSYTQNNTYGSSIAAPSGTYYGTIADGIYGNSSAVSFYVELESETAQQFDFLIAPKADGSRLIQINLNFQKEGTTARAIPSGAYDSSIRETLNYINTLRGPVLLRIGAEMDVWTDAVTPADFIAAYRYVADMARSLAPKAELIWSANYCSGWDVSAEDFYPGDAYVDWVGISLYYNYESSSTSEPWLEHTRGGRYADPVANAASVVAVARAHGKPVAVTEGGMTKNKSGMGEEYAARQIAKEFSTLTMVYPEIKSIIYCDKLINGNDYRLSGSAKSAADTAVAANPTLIEHGKSSAGTYIPLEQFNETVNGSLLLGAAGSTYANIDMSAVYLLDGRQIAATSGSPNACEIKASALTGAKHKLDVRLNDGEGYTTTLTYTLDARSGVLRVSSGWTDSTTESTTPATSPSNQAQSAQQSIFLNGRSVTLQSYQLLDANGNGTNYVRLRDIADLLDGTPAQFNVGWNNEAKRISLELGRPYTTRNGSEGAAPFSGPKDYELYNDPISANGNSIVLNGIMLSDKSGGYSYFKLRDLGAACGFTVDWTKETGIIINT